MSAHASRVGAVQVTTGLACGAFLLQAARPGALGLAPRDMLAAACVVKIALQGVAVWFAHRCALGFEPGTPVRRAWRLLSLGLLGFLLGQLAMAPYQIVLRRDAPFPSASDVFFLLGYPLLIAALVQFWRSYEDAGFPLASPAELWGLIGGALVVALGAGTPLLGPVLRTPGSAVEKTLNIVYPVLDFLMLLPTAVLLRAALRFSGGQVARLWWSILLGILSLVAADVGFTYTSTLGWARLDPVMHALFIACYGFLALGTLRQHGLLFEPDRRATSAA